MCSRRVNFFPQISQGYGRSPVCDRMCLLRMHWCMAEKLQYGHLNFFLMTVNSLTAREQGKHAGYFWNTSKWSVLLFTISLLSSPRDNTLTS